MVIKTHPHLHTYYMHKFASIVSKMFSQKSNETSFSYKHTHTHSSWRKCKSKGANHKCKNHMNDLRRWDEKREKIATNSKNFELYNFNDVA